MKPYLTSCMSMCAGRMLCRGGGSVHACASWGCCPGVPARSRWRSLSSPSWHGQPGKPSALKGSGHRSVHEHLALAGMLSNGTHLAQRQPAGKSFIQHCLPQSMLAGHAPLSVGHLVNSKTDLQGVETKAAAMARRGALRRHKAQVHPDLYYAELIVAHAWLQHVAQLSPFTFII